VSVVALLWTYRSAQSLDQAQSLDHVSAGQRLELLLLLHCVGACDKPKAS
jgi:hypothetical protein